MQLTFTIADHLSEIFVLLLCRRVKVLRLWLEQLYLGSELLLLTWRWKQIFLDFLQRLVCQRLVLTLDIVFGEFLTKSALKLLTEGVGTLETHAGARLIPLIYRWGATSEVEPRLMKEPDQRPNQVILYIKTIMGHLFWQMQVGVPAPIAAFR